MPIYKLLVRVADRAHPREWNNTQRGRIRAARMKKRGDVVVVVPDSHQFTERERNNPKWVIVRAEFDNEDQALSFIRQEVGDDIANPFLNHRVKNINLNRLFGGALSGNVADELTVTKEALDAATDVRPPGRDPDSLEGVGRGN